MKRWVYAQAPHNEKYGRHDEIQNELIELEKTSVEKIWIRELTLLKKNS